jgi:hypothetical protein
MLRRLAARGARTRRAHPGKLVGDGPRGPVLADLPRTHAPLQLVPGLGDRLHLARCRADPARPAVPREPQEPPRIRQYLDQATQLQLLEELLSQQVNR